MADCLYTGISSNPTLGNKYGKPLPFLLLNLYEFGLNAVHLSNSKLHDVKLQTVISGVRPQWLTSIKKVKVGFFYSATYSGNAATSGAVQS